MELQSSLYQSDDQESSPSSGRRVGMASWNMEQLSLPKRQQIDQTKQNRFLGLRPLSQLTLNEKVTAIVATFTVILAVATMAIEGSAIAIVSGLLAIIMGPYAHYQQTKVVQVVTMKRKSEFLKREILRLKGDNNRMNYFVEELEGRVEDLLDVEDALEIVSRPGDASINALQKDADTNLNWVCKMDDSVKTRAIETLVASICRKQVDREASPEDGVDVSLLISEEDNQKILKDLQNIVGLSVNESRWRETVFGSGSNNAVESIIDVIQNLLDDELPAMNRIFHMK